MSKGSRQRPHNKKKFDENYDRIFGKRGRTPPQKAPEKPQEPL